MKLNIKIHHGSVTDMPFDDEKYDGIFCYALIHLLNKPQRLKFLTDCYGQLNEGGFMVFTMVSDKVEIYGQGKLLSKNRFQLENGLRVYFYNKELAEKEFLNFGLKEIKEIEEPIKFMENQPPLKLVRVVCQKK